MRTLTYPLFGLALAATAAQAQDATTPSSVSDGPETSAPADVPPEPALPSDAVPPADTPLPTETSPAPAEPALPAPDATVADSAEFTDEQVDQFAEATVKVQEIDADASIVAEEKQARMATAVTETGLDPATYNKIGRAVAVDPELRSRVQVAMSRHAGGEATGPAGG